MMWTAHLRWTLGLLVLLAAAYALFRLVGMAPPPEWAMSHLTRVLAAVGLGLVGSWLIDSRSH